jgi:hypothetical protein
MINEATVALSIFDKILSVLGLIRDGKKKRSDKIDAALLALYAALWETRGYLRDRQSGKQRNRDREYNIARLWQTASVPLRSIDKEFASRCLTKASFWMEPEIWDKT